MNKMSQTEKSDNEFFKLLAADTADDLLAGLSVAAAAGLYKTHGKKLVADSLAILLTSVGDNAFKAGTRAATPRWIPFAHNSLPAVGQECLIVYSGRTQWMAAIWTGEKFVAADGYEGESAFDPIDNEQITYWQPLPPAPSSQKGEA
jgi:hypothetical protein